MRAAPVLPTDRLTRPSMTKALFMGANPNEFL
jgi:hypothetical protein